MVVTCPRCLTKFNFTDESQAFGAEINFRCCRCQEEFVATFQDLAVTLTDVIASLSETGPDELSLAASADSPAAVSEINLDEGLTSDLETIDADDVEFPVIDDDSDVAAVDEKTESSDQDDDQVVAVELEDDPVQPPATAARSQKNSPLLFICAVLILGMVFLIGSSLWQQFSLDMEKYLQLVEVSNQHLRLASDREVVILKGKVVNTSPKTVTELKIKGVLLDSNGKAVAEVVTGGGVSFSLDELDRLDGSKLAMLEKIGLDLPPDGGELPFMLVFYEYPADAGKCYVEISSFKVK